MYRETLTLGVVPNKRSFLSMVEAKRQKDCFMEEIRKIKASIVEIVDIDDNMREWNCLRNGQSKRNCG